MQQHQQKQHRKTDQKPNLLHSSTQKRHSRMTRLCRYFRDYEIPKLHPLSGCAESFQIHPKEPLNKSLTADDGSFPPKCADEIVRCCLKKGHTNSVERAEFVCLCSWGHSQKIILKQPILILAAKALLRRTRSFRYPDLGASCP